MGAPLLSPEFIRKWEPIYDEVADDEERYRKLVAQVKSEIENHGNLSQRTFVEIVRWKAARLLGNGSIGKQLNKGAFKTLYSPAIARAMRAADSAKIFELEEYGVGAPVASTILGFIYPDTFPIVDYRTVDVLREAGRIRWKTTSMANYEEFKRILRGVSQTTGLSLRQIDRALFAYSTCRSGD